MTDLNQYAVSKILGSTMKPLRTVGFGHFNLLASVGETLRAKETATLAQSDFKFGYEHDRVVACGFEDVRDGAAPDAILWDRNLSSQFNERCRELGLDAPNELLNRRLLNIRKNKARYERQGIILSPTTKKQPRPSIVPQYAHIIEFALVKLRYRFGASIDDILLDTRLCEEYEQLALASAPELDLESLRLAALYIRKSRFIKKNERESIRALNIQNIEDSWSPPISLAKVRSENIPVSQGLLELREGSRFLYIARNQSLRPAVQQLATGKPFEIMESSFWTPDLSAITIQYVVGNNIASTNVKTWEQRLIHDRRPIFNWPVLSVCA